MDRPVLAVRPAVRTATQTAGPERLLRIEPEQKPHVSIPRNQLIALVIGVCVLSAAIGSGLALLAQTGPHGPAGKQGPRGPAGEQGPEGQSGEAEVGEVEGQIGELSERVGGLEGALEEVDSEGGETGELEERIEQLEEQVSELGGLQGELCSELEFVC